MTEVFTRNIKAGKLLFTCFYFDESTGIDLMKFNMWTW